MLSGRNRALLLTDERSQGSIVCYQVETGLYFLQTKDPKGAYCTVYTEQTALMRNNVMYVYLQKEIKI